MIFTVNGVDWWLCYVRPNDEHLKRSNGTYTLGVTDNNDKTVYVATGLSDRLHDKVLCHEIVHAFCFSYGTDFDIYTEELIADFLATYGREVFNVADNILKRFLNVA